MRYERQDLLERRERRLAARRKPRKPQKEKLQFSKLHVLFANFIVFWAFNISAIVAWVHGVPISDVAITVVSVYGAFATGGYFAQNVMRDCSLNRLEAHRERCAVYGSRHDEEETGGY